MSASHNASRRAFLTGAATVAGAAAVGALARPASAAPHSEPAPQAWQHTADVVVIGAGGAGLMAAIQAHDAGAKVLVIDKGRSVFHTATRMSGGLFTAAGTKAQKEAGIADSAEQFAKDVMAYGGYMSYPDIVTAWTAASGKVFDWLADNGLAKFRLEPYGGHSNVRAVRQLNYTGRDYVETLWKQFQDRKITILFDTPVQGYIYDAKAGRVSGITAGKDGKNVAIQAQKAVILAAGGFTGDSKFIDSWIPGIAGSGVLIGCDANTGSAMMQAVRDLGLPLSHMQYTATYPWGLVTNERNGVACRFMYFVQSGGILVNKQGKRFISEETGLTKISVELPKQEGRMHFLLVDEAMWTETLGKYDIGALFSMPAWTIDRVNEELQKNNVLLKAATLAELAGKAGIPAQALADTVAAYNKAVKAKEDAAFKRQKLPREIGAGPYYMVKMHTWTNLTLGGVRVNTSMQALDAEGKPVKGLYAAGEVVGGVHGASYCGGNAISWCHTSGYLAGQNAAKNA